MDEQGSAGKGKRKHSDNAEPKFHLAQSSLKVINEIIKGYARGNGSMRLEEIAKAINKNEAPITLAHGFLMEIGIIDGNAVEKYSSPIGRKLGKYLALDEPNEVKKILQEIIIKNPFCITVLDEIASKGEMDKKTLRKRICFDAGYVIGADGEPTPRDANTGALALIKIFDQAGYITKPKHKRYYIVTDAYKEARSKVPSDVIDKGMFFISKEPNLDIELEQRCLTLLNAGSANPKIWDSVVRTAGVILEERLRVVGKIMDARRIGRELVNDVFGDTGTLAAKISIDSERQGYRELYAGIVGVFRNPNAHRLVDPTPEDGKAFVVFVNLLLKMLEDLR